MFQDPIILSPEEFELRVRHVLESCGAELDRFKTKHREKIACDDGTYEIDVTARFRALGVDFLVLVECKHQRNPIKREVVQILRDRIQSSGAHKGMLFATTTFQSGAVEYAIKHGIALIRISEWDPTYVTFSGEARTKPDDVRRYAYWLSITSENGRELMAWVSPDHPEALLAYVRETPVRDISDGHSNCVDGV
jgi:restriction system protein